jgi:colicin import membrane protein
MGDDDVGTVIQSRGFQFAQVETLHEDKIDYDTIWTPDPLKTYAPIQHRWIYVFQIADGQKALLAAEYHADKKGALGFVAGAKRRLVEPSAAPKPAPIPEAGLPLASQGTKLRYKFVATRGRMGKDAIWDMENFLHPVYSPVDLADPDSFQAGPNAQVFIPVIDILSIAEGLSKAYKVALNVAINKVVAHDKNPDKAKVEVQSRKYQLAKMINDSFLASEGGTGDPAGIRDSLAGGGATLTSFISDYESAIHKVVWNSRNAAALLVDLLNSPMYGKAYYYYLGEDAWANTIGHYYLDATFRSLDRLSETPEGRKLEREIVENDRSGLMSYLFFPYDDTDDDTADALMEQFNARFPIMRKAATAAVIGLGELAPALVLQKKLSSANQRKIASTISVFLSHTEVTVVMSTSRGEVAQVLRLEQTSLRIEVNYKQAKVDIEEWIEQGKPHWPEESKWASASELAGKLFVCVELVNFFNNFHELQEDPSAKTGFEMLGAGLDLACALEDPIRAWAKRADARRAAIKEARAAAADAGKPAADAAADAGGAAADAGGAAADVGAVGGAEAEAVGIFGKMTAPAVFKALGAASAGIDMVVYYLEAREAKERGDTGVATGNAVVASGSALILTSSLVNGAGYLMEAATLTAAASAFLVIGVVVLVVGYVLLAWFSTSSWQKFARHCSFGIEPAKPGKEVWSGGDFDQWTETSEGLERQMNVLTAMMCAFNISGGTTSGRGSDAESIMVTFGNLPPHSTLVVRFQIDYESGMRHVPEYEIDLETLHITCKHNASVADFQPYSQDGRIHSVLLSSDRPAAARGTKVLKSKVYLTVLYAGKSGKIPPRGECKYKLYDESIGLNFKSLNTLEFDKVESDKEDKADP